MLTFSEALHQELRGHGVTVTALAPGPVETDFWQIAGWETSSGKSFERAVPGTLISPSTPRAPASTGLDHGERVVVPGSRCASACSPAATSRTRSSCRRSSGSCAPAPSCNTRPTGHRLADRCASRARSRARVPRAGRRSLGLQPRRGPAAQRLLNPLAPYLGQGMGLASLGVLRMQECGRPVRRGKDAERAVTAMPFRGHPCPAGAHP